MPHIQYSPHGSKFTFIDLFGGIGGLRIPFEKIGGECVFSSEIDKYARQTYLKNFDYDTHQICEDITVIDPYDIPDHDLLVAGFPCQPFSSAGVSKKNALGQRHGFESDGDGTLFFNIEEILRAKRPAAFVLENVKNLITHNNGKTFARIIEGLTNTLGYWLPSPQYKLIDAHHFSPQHRERVVIVGFRDPSAFKWNNLILPETDQHPIREILEKRTNRKYRLTKGVYTALKRHAAKHKSRGNGFGYSLVSKDATQCRTLSARYYKDGAEILIDRGKYKLPRKLTPRECARLMGFPDEFEIPVSDTQAYRQFGNSVSIPVFDEVARIMKPHIVSTI